MKLILFGLIVLSASVSFSGNTPETRTSSKAGKSTVVTSQYCGFSESACPAVLSDIRNLGYGAFDESQHCPAIYSDGAGSDAGVAFSE